MARTPVSRTAESSILGPGSQPLFTIGYQGRTLEALIQLLRKSRVDRVVDVRELPLSRRKGFSKTPLSAALSREGIEYVHLRSAGNPFRLEKANIAKCLKLYAKHLDARPQVLAEVEEVVGSRRCALLCFEEKVTECHRSILVARLTASNPGRKVVHL